MKIFYLEDCIIEIFRSRLMPILFWSKDWRTLNQDMESIFLSNENYECLDSLLLRGLSVGNYQRLWILSNQFSCHAMHETNMVPVLGRKYRCRSLHSWHRQLNSWHRQLRNRTCNLPQPLENIPPKTPLCTGVFSGVLVLGLFFLRLQGLQQHQLICQDTPDALMIIINVPPKRGRPSGRDTIQTRLAEPASTEIPSPKFLVPAGLREFGKEINVYPSSRNP